MKILNVLTDIFKAIGSFFGMIGKGIVMGIVAVFKGMWWLLSTVAKAIWWFIVLVAKIIYKVIAYLVGLAVRYFLVYLPALIMIGYALLLIFNVVTSKLMFPNESISSVRLPFPSVTDNCLASM